MSNKIKVLIADSNVEYRTVLSDAINLQNDFEVVGIASDGNEVIEKINYLKPMLVIIEIIIPHIDGIEIIKDMEKLYNNPRPMIVAMSSYVNDSILSYISKFGILFFLIKPFETNVLINRVRDLMKYDNVIIPSKNTPEISNDVIVIKICNVLNKIGISENLCGYNFLIEALLIVYKNTEAISSITKLIYPEIAKKNKVSHIRVERSIRYAIDRAFINSQNAFQEIFDHNISTRPTNSKFIAILCKHIKLKDSLI